MTDYQKSIHNAQIFFRLTNASPIRKHDGVSYNCLFCPQKYTMPQKLKEHTLNEHKGMILKTAITDTIKLDITNMLCDICMTPLHTLGESIRHLIDEHGECIYTDIKNYIVPFKFEGPELKCVYCNRICAKFKVLLEHMNTHYNNYVCDVCGSSFITTKQYGLHLNNHKIGTFPCEHCPKVFNTETKRKYHVKLVHASYKANKCAHCDQRFANSIKKEKHMAVFHGVKVPDYKCLACDKVYQTRAALACHIKMVHLMERNFTCDYCDKSFFSKLILAEHMIKHTGCKEYVCVVCSKAYARKKTLREHIRIHQDDRRFKCERCGQAFVQKCSLRAHMKSKHGEVMY